MLSLVRSGGKYLPLVVFEDVAGNYKLHLNGFSIKFLSQWFCFVLFLSQHNTIVCLTSPVFLLLSSLCVVWLKPEKTVFFPGHDWTSLAIWQEHDSLARVILIQGNTEWKSNRVTAWLSDMNLARVTGWSRHMAKQGQRVIERGGGLRIWASSICRENTQNTLSLQAHQKSQLSDRFMEDVDMRERERERGRGRSREGNGDSLLDVELDVLACRGDIFRSITAHLCPYIKWFPQVGL